MLRDAASRIGRPAHFFAKAGVNRDRPALDVAGWSEQVVLEGEERRGRAARDADLSIDVLNVVLRRAT